MQMRFLYFTDTHIRGTSPRSRTDDFVAALSRKLTEIVKITHEKQVDYVLHGGDLFDRPNLAPAVVRDFITILRKLERPLYIVAGNHDIYGHNPLTVERTMLGLLEAFGVLKLLRPEDPVRLQKNGVTVQLSGQPFHHELDHRDWELDYAVAKPSGIDYTIHIVHGMLVDRPLPEGVAHTLVHQVWHDDVDVLLTGHYHTGFPIAEKSGHYIINPGALSRIESRSSEIKRRPKAVLISCGEQIEVEEIYLETAVPGEEILDRTYIESIAYRQEKLAGFVQQVRAAHDFGSIDVTSLIDEIATKEQVDADVRAEACRRIALVQERAEVSE